MLIYGDRSEPADPRGRLERIAGDLARIATMRHGLERHTRLVGALIDAGQLLQGVADADFAALNADRRTRASDALIHYVGAIARAVLRSWKTSFAEIGDSPASPRPDGLPSKVELRTPEGFAYYAVYPEAYIDAARRLRLTAHPIVIGIRSIGTTLGAVVAAALNASPPITLRPHGEPFARQVTIAAELEQELLGRDAHYVIVDEGPGQSGSSFGAVADWLQERGVRLERIAFLPSHAGPPGPHASPAHRARWHLAQRVPADFGGTLRELARRWVSSDSPLIDISAGEWRRYVYASGDDWPAATPAWERRKFLAEVRGEKLLLKFAGLGAIGRRKLGMARALHAVGLTPEPLGLVHGFLVERWCEDAQRLGPDEKPITELAHYIGARARLFPADPDSGATLAQLLEMSRRNIGLALGDAAIRPLAHWPLRLDALSRRVVRVRTDNRLDRHEWLRLADGRLLKTDALDHHAAHDLIGCQDMAWDVAGAVVEFELAESEAGALTGATERASGSDVDRELLAFYRVAYLAFRLGQASLAAQMHGSDAAETARLNAAAARYAAEAQRLLLQNTRATTRPGSLVG